LIPARNSGAVLPPVPVSVIAGRHGESLSPLITQEGGLPETLILIEFNNSQVFFREQTFYTFSLRYPQSSKTSTFVHLP
jgi:hypothetical protein